MLAKPWSAQETEKSDQKGQKYKNHWFSLIWALALAMWNHRDQKYPAGHALWNTIPTCFLKFNVKYTLTCSKSWENESQLPKILRNDQCFWIWALLLVDVYH